MKNSILAIAAHPDDEILGCGGTLLKHVSNGDKVCILILGDGETARSQIADVQKRAQQATQVAKGLGVEELFLEKLPDNQFDSIPLLRITKLVEKYIDMVQPSILYTHFPHDLNIDHRRTFQAALTAARPQPNYPVRKILAFETLSSTEWQTKKTQYQFLPTVYHDITPFINQKIELMRIYADELRAYPHPRSPEGIRILAQFRGLEVGLKYAEAFQLIRHVC